MDASNHNKSSIDRFAAECVSKFGDFVSQIEDHREKIIEDSEIHFIEPLRKFRIEGIGKVSFELYE